MFGGMRCDAKSISLFDEMVPFPPIFYATLLLLHISIEVLKYNTTLKSLPRYDHMKAVIVL